MGILNSGGSIIRSSNVPVTLALAQSAVPVGIAPTGTMAANGALTCGTALNLTYSSIWLYFPAGAVYAGSAAGAYYTVMSSTTLGTVYDNVLGTATPYVPAAPVAIVAAGPGAYTGITAETTLVTVPVPGNLMGINGALESCPLWTMNNSANNKILRVRLGTTVFSSLTQSAAATLQNIIIIRNRGVLDKQIGNHSTSFGFSVSTAAPITGTIDTSTDQNVTFTGQLAVATDFLVLEGFMTFVNKPYA